MQIFFNLINHFQIYHQFKFKKMPFFPEISGFLHKMPRNWFSELCKLNSNNRFREGTPTSGKFILKKNAAKIYFWLSIGEILRKICKETGFWHKMARNRFSKLCKLHLNNSFREDTVTPEEIILKKNCRLDIFLTCKTQNYRI